MTARQKLLSDLEGLTFDDWHMFHCDSDVQGIAIDALELLKSQPEQKHGHWVLDPDGMDWNIPAWRCSVCGCRNDNIPPNVEKTNPRRWSGSRFCPNCGATMDEGVKQDGRC